MHKRCLPYRASDVCSASDVCPIEQVMFARQVMFALVDKCCLSYAQVMEIL